MHLAQQCQYAVDFFANRLEDKQIHYGLVFVLPGNPDSAEIASIRKRSDLDTYSRHGTIEDWHLGRPLASLPSQQVVLLIPRTWLIQQGYLPWWVLICPYRAFALRRVDVLQRHFWLVGPACGSRDEEASARRAA